VVEDLPSPRPAEPAIEPEKAMPSGSAAHSESYDKLVADGDRLLQSGSSAKAKDLYQKALRVRSSGWKALCGLGFATLRQGQIPAAYEYFKRTLSAKPSYPPALFGLAEIHRARGERTLALQSYKHYLQITPNGKEAEAARHQMETLQASR
jgi:tetratricopeptide (TPR) repeat protein